MDRASCRRGRRETGAERRSPRFRALLVLSAGLLPAVAWGGTTGKLAGRVVNQSEAPVVAVTVTLEGTRLGAFSNDQGTYTILNVPAGTYTVRFQRIGYEPQLVQGVVVSSDRTTTLDARLKEVALETEAVVVTADRPPVDLGATSTQVTLTKEEIATLPVQELSDVVKLQAGVVDGHFRGGRKEEVQYQVDGVSVNNAYDNSSSLRLDRSLLQEVQVISGTFDAEYGQAMSGVVNAVLKQGTRTLQGSAEAYGGGFFFSDTGTRRVADGAQIANIGSLQLTLTGPTPHPGTVFLLSGRYAAFDDYVQGRRLFLPTDASDFENKVYRPTGDGSFTPLGYSDEWTGAAKITNTSLPDTKLNYQAVFNILDGRRLDFAYRLNPDGAPKQHTGSISHGIDVSHTFSKSTYLDLSLRQNYFTYHDWVYENVWDPRYDEAGPAIGDVSYENGAIIQGVDLDRFVQKTNTPLLKTSVTHQLDPVYQVKAGGEIQFPAVSFGVPGYLLYTTSLVRHVNEPPDYPGVKRYFPVIGATFVQGVAEKKDLTVRAGLRLDYFSARSETPGDLANPANDIEGQPTADPVPTTAKVKLSPRLGLAFPIEDRAAVHFAYGHFYQYPAIGTIFANADYGVLHDLQAGGVNYGVLGNPDVEPEKTVQYELGYKHTLTEDIGLDFTVYYKDIRDLLGVEFISTYNDAEYARLTNADFGDVVGFTFAFDHRRLGPVRVALDYTWQRALGNSSDPRETATRAEAGEDPRPRLAYFNWDLRHKLDLTLTMSEAGKYAASAVVRAASGQPYTPVLEAGFGNGLEANSGRKPSGVVVDLRGEKSLNLGGTEFAVFSRVFNLLDTKFTNGFVFNSTGSPYYSRFPEADAVTLADPTRFAAPRRVEMGVTVAW